MGCGATFTQRGPRLAGGRKVHVSHKQYKILKVPDFANSTLKNLQY